MPFTLRQLEIFAEAAKDENFRKTADRLGIAQPSVSKHIKALESAAGGVFFERQRGSAARLTPSGQEMLERARSMLKMAGKMLEGSQPARGELPSLRIAAGHYLLDQWLRPALPELLHQKDMPEIQFIQAGHRDEALAVLRNGDADCAFYHGDPAEIDEFSTRVLRDSTVGLYATPQLASKVQVLPQDLAAMPFVMSPAGSHAEDYQLRQLESVGITPRAIAARSQYTEYQLALVKAGRGIGLLFDNDTRRQLAAGELVRFPLNFMPGMRCMVTSLARPPFPSHARAIELICNILIKP